MFANSITLLHSSTQQLGFYTSVKSVLLHFGAGGREEKSLLHLIPISPQPSLNSPVLGQSRSSKCYHLEDTHPTEPKLEYFTQQRH